MRGQTKAQKFNDISDTLKCLKTGTQPHRLGERRKDGSLPTHPTRPVKKPEAEVLMECLEYLRRKGYLVNRLNNTKMIVRGQWQVFGIIGGGDIIGMTKEGRHIEVECKAGMGGEWRVEQQRRCKQVRDHKGLYLLVHSVEELQEMLSDDSRSTGRQDCDEDVAQEDSEGFDPIE